MTTTKRPGFFQPNTLALAVALSAVAPLAQAITFNIGEIEGQFDSSLSLGASWALRNADPDLVGSNNGGKSGTHTTDDGRLNFKKGETFSKIFKGIHDLELKYRDTGIFLRGKYWYDFELKDESRPFKDISDHNRKEASQSSGAELLDAFIYHNYDIANQPGSVRLGKQVVSWGESTFIANSINSINPVDVAAFRRPGAEIKEGLIPVNMFYVSQSLTENLAAEVFYQLEWDQTVLDNCGTFFGNDVVPDGCDNNHRNLVGPQFLNAFEPIFAAAGHGYQLQDAEGALLPRGGDRDARDSGQWGLALRWMGDATEYGAYFMNYHSRTPYFSTQPASQAYHNDLPGMLVGPGGVLENCLGMGLGAACGSVLEGTAFTSLLGNSNYFMEYPEDIKLYGLSFATTLESGTAWSGEISYRPNMPLQINTADITLSLADSATGILGAPALSPIGSKPGVDTHGYRRKEVTQAQTTLTHFFDQVMGADRLTLVGELGVTRIGGLESRRSLHDGLSYGRNPEVGQWAPNNQHGFYTSTSWGYRARGILEFNNVFAGVNLKPNLAWSHDVDGYGPTFNEGSKAISLGLDADYRNVYTASLSYTDFFGGDYNTSIDRDFVAFSVGINF
ncbi:DUF1302 domain-containing protein [Zestomonas carbonaria]|uniref:DUF1302 domain-containing protein n=1 Tax=Zestomonas carbonaria TaxID=2762745 RepID=A0A7U7I9Q0_9GAMM|nr:DUF1302 domain-containing protein [Pseudomonas carbonaria]CAD5108416.1 hypothetical protein PSEWESI4_02701 [Pseudomonas carbonaria]